MKILDDIARYAPFNEQEQRDKALILRYLAEHPGCFYRADPVAHMTASAWVVNAARDRVLMVYHKIYDSWSWTGGHADGETDLLAVALREVTEETGVKSVRPVSEEIFSLEVVTVDGHEKRGAYVSSHLHLNVTYLLEADDAEPLRVCEDENRGVAWFGLDEALRASTEPWFVKRIYGKLNEKLKETL
ncbi:MAG: NUDIX hydrolase [Oscillospiraceae bacterium]|nr:NUDIX hydrolase [Oscillospiraceae bacterium]